MGLISTLNALGEAAFGNDSSCTKNIIKRKFLWREYTVEGQHKLKITHVGVWGASSWKKYEVDAQCELCKANFHTFGVTEDELIRAGVEIPKY